MGWGVGVGGGDGGGAHVERGVGAVDAAADDLAVVDEDAADGRFVRGEGQLGHFDGFAHEAFVVLAVGDGSEDHCGLLCSEGCPMMCWCCTF